MKTQSRAVKIAALAAACAFPLALTACGGGAAEPASAPSSAAAPVSSPAASSPASSPSASASASTAGTEPFGAACSAVPKSGKGSFDGMSQDPVATAASNNPLLSTLVSAVKKADLVDTLNTTDDITVFAPTNDAFDKIDKDTLDKVLSDKKMLTAILTAHVVPGRLSPDELSGKHDSLNKNAPVTVEGSGEDFTVNGKAEVLCGNVQTANATVYIIDTVLMPAM